MSLNIKNPEAYRLARKLAQQTGESLTDAVIRSLEERLSNVGKRRDISRMLEDVQRIQRAIAALPDRDLRSAEEIIGYDEFGLPR